MALTRAQIDAACRGSREDLRRFLHGVYDQLEMLNGATGNNFLAPTNSPLNPSKQPPAYATVDIAGANGIFGISITNPSQSINQPIYHELSYSEDKSFMTGVTTLPPTSATSFPVSSPGTSVFWRYRSSFDRSTWNNYRLVGSTPIDAGLLSSAATSPNLLLNQTNFSNVTSRDPGTGVVQIQIGAVANPYLNYLSTKGGTESVRPSATIVNVAPASTQYVAWDNDEEQYVLENQMPDVMDDALEPVAVVSVVGTGAFALPTLAAFRSSGGIVGFLIGSSGNGLCSLLNITIADSGGGTGAAAGQQTIVGGKLVNLTAGTPGSGYSAAVTVTASGGGYTAPGGGGGGLLGGNGGRHYLNPIFANIN